MTRRLLQPLIHCSPRSESVSTAPCGRRNRGDEHRKISAVSARFTFSTWQPALRRSRRLFSGSRRSPWLVFVLPACWWILEICRPWFPDHHCRCRKRESRIKVAASPRRQEWQRSPRRMAVIDHPLRDSLAARHREQFLRRGRRGVAATTSIFYFAVTRF